MLKRNHFICLFSICFLKTIAAMEVAAVSATAVTTVQSIPEVAAVCASSETIIPVDPSRGFACYSNLTEQGTPSLMINTPYNVQILFDTQVTKATGVLFELGKLAFSIGQNWITGTQFYIYDGSARLAANTTTQQTVTNLQGLDITKGKISLTLPRYHYAFEATNNGESKHIIVDDIRTLDFIRSALPLFDNVASLDSSLQSTAQLESLYSQAQFMSHELKEYLYLANEQVKGQVDGALAWLHDQLFRLEHKLQTTNNLMNPELAIAMGRSPDIYIRYLHVSNYRDPIVKEIMKTAANNVAFLHANKYSYIPINKLKDLNQIGDQQLTQIQAQSKICANPQMMHELRLARLELKAQQCFVAIHKHIAEQTCKKHTSQWFTKNYTNLNFEGKLQELIKIAKKLKQVNEGIRALPRNSSYIEKLPGLLEKYDSLSFIHEAIKSDLQKQVPQSTLPDLLQQEVVLHEALEKLSVSDESRELLVAQQNTIYNELAKRFTEVHLKDLQTLKEQWGSQGSPSSQNLFTALNKTLKKPNKVVTVNRSVPLAVKEQIKALTGNPDFFDRTVHNSFGQGIYQQCFENIVEANELKCNASDHPALTDLVTTKTIGITQAAIEQALLGNYSLAADLAELSNKMQRLYGMAEGIYHDLVITPCSSLRDLTCHIFNSYCDAVLHELLEHQPQTALAYANPIGHGAFSATKKLLVEGINIPITLGENIGDALIFLNKLRKGYPDAWNQYRAALLHIAKLPPREQGFQAGHTLSWIFPAGTVAEGVGTAAKTSLAKAVNTIGLEESVSRLTELFATKFRYETAVAEGTQLQRGLLEQAEKTAVAEKISAKSAWQALKESTMLQKAEKVKTGAQNIIESNLQAYSAHSYAQYDKLKHALRIEEFSSVVKLTKHGLQRLMERGFRPNDVMEAITNPTMLRMQEDGSKAFIKQINNRYTVIIINEKAGEVVTALKNIDSKALANLGKNYGW